MRSGILASAIGASLAASATAGSRHRALAPNVHGQDVLTAMGGARVSLRLDVPGMGIIGYEHASSGADQQTLVQDAKTQLAKPLDLFKFPDAAGCKVTHARADGPADIKQDRAAYILECSQPNAIGSTEFEYFKHFKNAHGPTVNIVSDEAQITYEVSTEKQPLKLGGTM